LRTRQYCGRRYTQTVARSYGIAAGPNLCCNARFHHGERAGWKDIEEIKQWLLEPAARGIGEQLGRRPELIIEKDKITSGPIHPSMFREALDSDVYIADLSGANPNVYLELGVRWALRDGVTILQRNPVNLQAHYELGIMLRNAAVYDEAIEELQKVVELKADWAPGWRELGVAFSKSGHLTEGRRGFPSRC
jgi:tetratricopeptide (TPR) repeat protein